MGEPERDQLRLEAESLRVRVGDPGEVLQADEGGCPPPDHQLAGIGSADTDHEYHVDVDVRFDQPCAPLLGCSCEGDDVGPGEHRAKVGASGVDRPLDNVAEMRTFGVDDVVVPVCLQQTPMGGVVPLIGGDPVGALENREEIREQIDEHCRGRVPSGRMSAGGGRGRRSAFRDSGRRWARIVVVTLACEQEHSRMRALTLRNAVSVTRGTILPFANTATAHGE
jgi:hypothetical protein